MNRPNQANKLLHELCGKYGHCGSAVHVTDLLPDEGTITSQEFATKMLEAEYPDGLDYDPVHRKACLELYRTKFEEHLRGKEADVAIFNR